MFLHLEIFFKTIPEDTEPISTASADGASSCQIRPTFVLIASDDSYHTCLACAFQRSCRGSSSRDHPDVPQKRKENSCQHCKLLWNWKVSYGRRSREKSHYGPNVPAREWTRKPRFYTSLSFRLCAYDLILIGFPPPDFALRGYILSIVRKYGKARLANLLCSIFAVLHGRLEAIASGNYFQFVLRVAYRLCYRNAGVNDPNQSQVSQRPLFT
jgi:hypothetical protein